MPCAVDGCRDGAAESRRLGYGGNVGKGSGWVTSFAILSEFATLDQCSSQPAPASEGRHFCGFFLPREKSVATGGRRTGGVVMEPGSNLDQP